eukprot:scaffold7357_cov195-Pinguiococcus_pyrenoidosus.AAC.6
MALLASWPLTVYWVDARGESGFMDITVTRAFALISTWASSSFFFLIAADLRGVGRKQPERSHMSRVEAAYVLVNASSCTAVSLCLLVRPEDASYGVYHQYFFFGNSLVIFLLLVLAAVGYVRSANYAIRQCLDLASPSLVSTVKKLRRLRLIVCFAAIGLLCDGGGHLGHHLGRRGVLALGRARRRNVVHFVGDGAQSPADSTDNDVPVEICAEGPWTGF